MGSDALFPNDFVEDLLTLTSTWSEYDIFVAAKEIKQETANVGETVKLRCWTTVRFFVDWRRQDTLESDHTYIYSNGQVWPDFQSRFSVKVAEITDTVDEYALMIADAQLNDSAYYLCKEDGGIGPEHYFHLNVTNTSTGVLSAYARSSVCLSA